MDAFTPLDQGNTSFTSPITDFNMDDWVTDADGWNTLNNFDALLVTQPLGLTNQRVGDGFRHANRFENVPVEFANCYRTDMLNSDKTETSELGQGSFTSTWGDSTIPNNDDEDNSVLRVTTTSAAPGSSRECSCITCLDLGSNNVDTLSYRCRLPDCNFSAVVAPYRSGYVAERTAHKHEKSHFRHDGRYRCMEDCCVYGAKRWPDLKRHYTSKHCLNPKTKFRCPEIGCKYGGDNGFTRKDKLKSHRDKVHGKRTDTEKRSRVSKYDAQGAA